MRTIGSLLVAVILAGPFLAHAATIHVSLLGNDGNDGLSWAAPKR